VCARVHTQTLTHTHTQVTECGMLYTWGMARLEMSELEEGYNSENSDSRYTIYIYIYVYYIYIYVIYTIYIYIYIYIYIL
jgi:hypothetical protein